VSVDRWPTEFTYASRRILGDIVSQHEATRDNPFRIGKLRVGVGAFGTETERRPAEANEVFALIRRATQYISDRVGTLDDPELAPYVHAKIHLFSRRVSLWSVWEDKYDHEIATFTACREALPGLGRVFLALVGSGSNFLGRPQGRQSAALRTPSDAYGLYDIVNECLEANDDPTLRPEILRQELDMLGSKRDDRWFQEVATTLIAKSTSIMPMERVDVLFKPHRVLYDVDLDRWGMRGTDLVPGVRELPGAAAEPLERYAVAVIGAPLWIAKSVAADDVVLPSGLRRYQADTAPSISDWSAPTITQPPRLALNEASTLVRELSVGGRRWDPSVPVCFSAPPAKYRSSDWNSFDDQLKDTLRPRSNGDQSIVGTPPLTDQEWQSFCRWFVDQAVRFGGTPAPLQATRRHWVRHSRETPKNTGDRGWIVPFMRHQCLIVLTDYRCVLTYKWGQSTQKYGVAELEPGLREAAFRALLLEVRDWWLLPG